jgi:hypothetical protein
MFGGSTSCTNFYIVVMIITRLVDFKKNKGLPECSWLARVFSANISEILLKMITAVTTEKIFLPNEIYRYKKEFISKEVSGRKVELNEVSEPSLELESNTT